MKSTGNAGNLDVRATAYNSGGRKYSKRGVGSWGVYRGGGGIGEPSIN